MGEIKLWGLIVFIMTHQISTCEVMRSVKNQPSEGKNTLRYNSFRIRSGNETGSSGVNRVFRFDPLGTFLL